MYNGPVTGFSFALHLVVGLGGQAGRIARGAVLGKGRGPATASRVATIVSWLVALTGLATLAGIGAILAWLSTNLGLSEPAAVAAIEVTTRVPFDAPDEFALTVPALGRTFVVRPGPTEENLRAGPAYDPAGGTPGREGNIVVYGHRNSYDRPFDKLGQLRPGDELTVTLGGQQYHYRVEQIRRVLPAEVPSGPLPGRSLLTLVTCDPPGSTAYRLVVTAVANVRQEESGVSNDEDKNPHP